VRFEDSLKVADRERDAMGQEEIDGGGLLTDDDSGFEATGDSVGIGVIPR